MSVSFEDTTRDGYADRRQIYHQGAVVRLEADTNADRKPDVWVTFSAGKARFQDEDTDFDGVVDSRFDLETDESVSLDGSQEPPSLEAFGRLSCREFSAFWKR